MKIGVSYNVFDGEELLKGSLEQIRGFADHISVVYQDVSNFGNRSSRDLKQLLMEFKSAGLVDQIQLYVPQNIPAGLNESNKRNIGLDIARHNGCTHYMTMDTDEYYFVEELSKLKKDILQYDWDSTFCQMRTYYKTWEYQLDPPETYFVPLVYKIYPNMYLHISTMVPVLTDPTRKYNAGKFKVYERSFIEMHHGSYIRDNIRSKVENSTALVNLGGRQNQERIISYYESWEYPSKALLIGLGPREWDLVRVDKKF